MSEFTIDVEREEDGRWIGEVTDLPGVLTYGATREEAVAKTKALAFACSPTVSITAKRSRNFTAFSQSANELAIEQGFSRSLRAPSHRLVRQTSIRNVTQDSSTRRLAGRRFSFHDQEEIGLRMLARIAKRTGLTPSDL
jgi:predicted RNase H-like HicB family nuclease